MTCDRRQFLLILAAGAVGCAAGIPVLRYGVDVCDFCRMTISDPEFAALAETAKGRAARFDSIECLARWIEEQEEFPRNTWVTDFATPSVMLATNEARFYRAAVRSSMGQGWIASDAKRTGAPLPKSEGPYTWDETRRGILAGAEEPHGGRH